VGGGWDEETIVFVAAVLLLCVYIMGLLAITKGIFYLEMPAHDLYTFNFNINDILERASVASWDTHSIYTRVVVYCHTRL
jgi:hypothetical protein